MIRGTLALRPVAAGAVLAVLATALVALGSVVSPASAAGRLGTAVSPAAAPAHLGTFGITDVSAPTVLTSSRTNASAQSTAPDTDPDNLGLAAILPDRTLSVAPAGQSTTPRVAGFQGTSTSKSTLHDRAPPFTAM